MAEAFFGQIKMFAGTFAPQGWAFCNGQLLLIEDHDALFSLLGTTYGGDGRTTFALPDLRGRSPIHVGSGLGLSTRRLGSRGGEETVEITAAHLPGHRHVLQAANVDDPLDSVPTGKALNAINASVSEATPYIVDPHTQITNLHADSIATAAGGSLPHNNMQPSLVINFIIALVGVYPARD